MTPIEHLRDCPAAILECGARAPSVGVRRGRIGPSFHRRRDRRPGFREHRRCRRVIEIQALSAVQNRWFPANCHMNARPYIGPDAAAHPRRPTLFTSIATYMPEVIFPGP